MRIQMKRSGFSMNELIQTDHSLNFKIARHELMFHNESQYLQMTTIICYQIFVNFIVKH